MRDHAAVDAGGLANGLQRALKNRILCKKLITEQQKIHCKGTTIMHYANDLTGELGSMAMQVSVEEASLYTSASRWLSGCPSLANRKR